ncbi:MAG: hypothetical protein R2684_02680 [Pyrinomonadaceae bacterium]
MRIKQNLFTAALGTIAVSMFFLFPASADAQRVKRSRTVSSAATNAADLKKGATDVSIQIKNISKFAFVLGGVATGIENIDKEVQAGRATSEIKAKNEEFKSNVRASFQGIRAALVKLEVDFRTKPALKKYLPQIEGIGAQGMRSEDFAFAGRFNDGGKELLLVIEKLADTLQTMP